MLSKSSKQELGFAHYIVKFTISRFVISRFKCTYISFCFLFFRKKLRGAVYDALVERKINENDPLFRPCFKKLFDICSVFAQNMPKDTNSTKKWLSVVANQNADSVINLEKALRQ